MANNQNDKDVIKLLTDDIQSHRDYIQRLYRSAFLAGGVALAIALGLIVWVFGKQLDSKIIDYFVEENVSKRIDIISKDITDQVKKKAAEEIGRYSSEEIGNQVTEKLTEKLETLTESDLSSIIDQLTFPAGIVVAYDSDKCPTGWKTYHPAAGRFVLGANPDGLHGLTESRYSDTGGEEQHVLTKDEIPEHSHVYTSSLVVDSSHETDISIGFERKNQLERTTSADGNQPHNNMPPYIVLQFCQRDTSGKSVEGAETSQGE